MSAETAPTSRGPFAGILGIGCVALAAVIGLIVWGGGDPDIAQGGVPEGPTPTAPSTAGRRPTTTSGGGVGAAARPAEAPTSTNATAARNALLNRLPKPAGATEQGDDEPARRTWISPKANWKQQRNAYVRVLRRDAGLKVTVAEQVDQNGIVGTAYDVTDPRSGATIEVVVGLVEGQTVIEATR